MVKKTGFLILFAIGFQSFLSAQEKPFFTEFTLKKGVGFKTLSVNYAYINIPTSEKIYYHPGGGTGLQAGMGYKFSEKISLGFYGVYQLVFNEKVQNIGSFKNRSSAVFNRKTVKADLQYLIPANNKKILTGLYFNAGADYHFPGKLVRKQNSEKLKTLYYDNSTGYHLGTGMLINLNPEKGLSLNIGVSFRFADFEVSDPDPDAPELDKISASGVDIKVSLRNAF